MTRSYHKVRLGRGRCISHRAAVLLLLTVVVDSGTYDDDIYISLSTSNPWLLDRSTDPPTAPRHVTAEEVGLSPSHTLI